MGVLGDYVEVGPVRVGGRSRQSFDGDLTRESELHRVTGKDTGTGGGERPKRTRHTDNNDRDWSQTVPRLKIELEQRGPVGPQRSGP